MQQKAVRYRDKAWAPRVAPSCGHTDCPLLFPSASDLPEGAQRLYSHPASHPLCSSSWQLCKGRTMLPGSTLLHDTVSACPSWTAAQLMPEYAPSEEQRCENPLKVLCKELLCNRLKSCSSFFMSSLEDQTPFPPTSTAMVNSCSSGCSSWSHHPSSSPQLHTCVS